MLNYQRVYIYILYIYIYGYGSKAYPPVVHIEIAGIHGCEYPPKNGINRY